jgi:hypothetical protein
MSHPLRSLEPRLLGSLTFRLGGLLVFGTALIIFLDVPLRAESSPWGIVSFELAGTPHRALQILLEWKSRGVIGYAKLIQIADFVYLILYGMFFAALALWVGSRLDEAVWSTRAAWAATYAAAFDVLENVVLLYEVVRFTSPAPFPQLAASFAGVKFTLLIFSASYAVIGGIAVLRRR